MVYQSAKEDLFLQVEDEFRLGEFSPKRGETDRFRLQVNSAKIGAIRIALCLAASIATGEGDCGSLKL